MPQSKKISQIWKSLKISQISGLGWNKELGNYEDAANAKTQLLS